PEAAVGGAADRLRRQAADAAHPRSALGAEAGVVRVRAAAVLAVGHRATLPAAADVIGVLSMDETLPTTEGRIPYAGAETWYQIVGGGEADGKLPVLILHGGPGGTHDYLEPMAGLANTGRRVIFYDQIGCGNSPHPSDPSKWTVQLFVDEVDAV